MLPPPRVLTGKRLSFPHPPTPLEKASNVAWPGQRPQPGCSHLHPFSPSSYVRGRSPGVPGFRQVTE